MNPGLAEFLDHTLNGLILGGVFALVAVGYSLVYGIIKLINFAHGEIAMFGAFFAWMVLGWQGGIEDRIGSVDSWLMFLGVVLLTTILLQLATRRATRDGRAMTLLVLGAAGLAWWSSEGSAGLSTMAFTKALLFSLVLTIILGILLEFIAYRPLRKASRLSALITAIGMSLILQNLAAWIWAPEDMRMAAPPFFNEIAFTLGSESPTNPDLVTLDVTWKYIVIPVLVFLAMALLWYLVEKTRMGKAMRASSQDADAAALMGININRVVSYTFILGAGMAALSGFLMSTHIPVVRYDMGVQIGVVAFAAAVLGGIGSIPGAVLGGFLIGFSQSYAAGYLSVLGENIGHSSLTAAYKESVAFLIMILFLIFKPTGLMGSGETDRA